MNIDFVGVMNGGGWVRNMKMLQLYIWTVLFLFHTGDDTVTEAEFFNYWLPVKYIYSFFYLYYIFQALNHSSWKYAFFSLHHEMSHLKWLSYNYLILVQLNDFCIKSINCYLMMGVVYLSFFLSLAVCLI